MAAFYLDTSALVKNYVQEQGAVWIGSLTAPSAAHDIYTIRLTGPEMIAALFRNARVGQLPMAGAVRAAANFRADWQHQFQIIEVSILITDIAMTLVERYGLRGYDSVHLAAALDLRTDRQALQLPPLTFVSADADQLRAAQAEGLVTENPNNYR